MRNERPRPGIAAPGRRSVGTRVFVRAAYTIAQTRIEGIAACIRVSFHALMACRRGEGIPNHGGSRVATGVACYYALSVFVF